MGEFDVTHVADAAAFWRGGEWDVKLGAACWADGEVAGWEVHGGGLAVECVEIELVAFDCRAMMRCLCRMQSGGSSGA